MWKFQLLYCCVLWKTFLSTCWTLLTAELLLLLSQLYLACPPRINDAVM